MSDHSICAEAIADELERRGTLRRMLQAETEMLMHWHQRAEAAEAKVARVEALADDWLTDAGDHLGRPRSWWDEQWYGQKLRDALRGDS